MMEAKQIAQRTAFGCAIVLGVTGMILGTALGFVYGGGSGAWFAGLIFGIEAAVVGGAIGALVGFAFAGLRSVLCRRVQYASRS